MKLCFIMDPIEKIKIKKDTTFAMMLEAQKRGWEINYAKIEDLFFKDNHSQVSACALYVEDNSTQWVEYLTSKQSIPLKEYDFVLMRKDPPFNMQYIYATYLLELAEKEGANVLNRPSSLRDCNEKLFTTWFPQCTPPTLVGCKESEIRDFINEYNHCVLKPLDGMGGKQVFVINKKDPNLSVIIETLTESGITPIMVQEYISAIKKGDKRILVIDGKPFPYALNRVPKEGETRGNLVAGAKGEAVKITKHDEWICDQIGPTLHEKGLLFVGVDIIGEYLTEINITSPTCAREIEGAFGLSPCAAFFDALTRT